MNTKLDPICPYCGSTDIEFEDVKDETWDNDCYYIRTYTCLCMNCEKLFDFREYYQLYMAEHSRREDSEWHNQDDNYYSY